EKGHVLTTKETLEDKDVQGNWDCLFTVTPDKKAYSINLDGVPLESPQSDGKRHPSAILVQNNDLVILRFAKETMKFNWVANNQEIDRSYRAEKKQNDDQIDLLLAPYL